MKATSPKARAHKYDRFVTCLLVFACLTATYPAAADNIVFGFAAGIGGTRDDEGRGITLDELGNVYTTGFFNGTVDFDPGPGVYNLTGADQDDIFVSKLNSSGHFVWAKAMAGAFTERGFAIAVDRSGNVYTTGIIHSTTDFDPGEGTANLTSTGFADIFVCKLDSDGEFVWAKRIGSGGDDQPSGIAVDGSGNVYTTGFFNGTVDFDPGEGTTEIVGGNDHNMFVLKLDTAGDFIWARAVIGTNHVVGNDIAVDTSGKVYTTGWFEGTADFDPGEGTANFSSGIS